MVSPICGFNHDYNIIYRGYTRLIMIKLPQICGHSIMGKYQQKAPYFSIYIESLTISAFHTGQVHG